jgi:hydroxyethylthiazole kinase-like uncharacterized protein yjeF
MHSDDLSSTKFIDLYTLEQIRQIEQTAQKQFGADYLMHSAAQAALELVNSVLPKSPSTPSNILILAGSGDNGGDALELARLLAQDAHIVSVVVCGSSETYSTAAHHCYLRAQQSSINFISKENPELLDNSNWDVLIDGLFGIGLCRPITGLELKWVKLFNHLHKTKHTPVIALDIPSGLDVSTGFIIGDECIHATHTISFIANKIGLHMNHAKDYVGQLHISDLQLSKELLKGSTSQLIQAQHINTLLPKRSHASNKGCFGKVFVIGGALGMLGAPLLSAKTALMSGAGRVYVAQLGNAGAFFETQSELMSLNIHQLELHDGISLIGPGLGNSDLALTLIKQTLVEAPSLVIDADALNCIAQHPHLQALLQQRHSRNQHSLLTPHPLEAARLLNCSIDEVQSHRVASCQKLARHFSCTIILKGSGSVICSDTNSDIYTETQHSWINSTGNPALATAGTGDVLAGLCAALLAQNCSPHEAAMMASYIHGLAADQLVNQGIGPIGLTASELIVEIRRLLNQFSTT